jgi:GAF domain-containing protein
VIFVARATSIAVLDASAGEFVFEAVAGEGAGSLIGARFLAGEGIAGAVVATGRPIVVDDLSRETRFARDVATETGYLADAMMSAPLRRGDRTLGVLSVLDPALERDPAERLVLLEAFAAQAAIAVELGEQRAAALDTMAGRPVAGLTVGVEGRSLLAGVCLAGELGSG